MNTLHIYRKFFITNTAALLLLFSGLVGLVASFSLTLDKIKLLENPAFVPGCSLNPVVSCLSAMSSHQSEIMGIPNSLMGLMLYTALVVISVLLLLRVTMPRIVWRGMLVFGCIGILFVHYLIVQSLFVLHVICPWCLSIWLTSPILFFALISLYQKQVTQETIPGIRQIVDFLSKQKIILAAAWYMLLLIAVGVIFRDFWATLL